MPENPPGKKENERHKRRWVKTELYNNYNQSEGRNGDIELPGGDDGQGVGHDYEIIVVVVGRRPPEPCICRICTLRYEDQGFDIEMMLGGEFTLILMVLLKKYGFLYLFMMVFDDVLVLVYDFNDDVYI